MSKLVPIALMVFNRPDLTIRIMDQLSKSRPPLLYVIADGPRNKEEELICSQTREIALNPTWPCKVVPFVREKNVGMVRQFKEGLDFVFEKNDRLIFMEDDHLLSPSFYRFSVELLEKYLSDEQIGHINLSNLIPSYSVNHQDSYLFSTHFFVWGFATWKRVWKTYDISMPEWLSVNQSKILDKFCFSARERTNAKKMFDLHAGNTKPWTYDYQLTFNCLHRNTLAITPTRNLCKNIGFEREDAIHNKGSNPFLFPLDEVNFPLTHPNSLKRNIQFDRHLSDKICPSTSKLITNRIINKMKKLFGKCTSDDADPA
jgi:hypothetical protein